MAETSNTPPMDEILASIRRIITDEPPLSGSVASGSIAAEPVAASAPSKDDDDVLELGETASGDIAVAPALPAPADPSALLSHRTQAASQQALAALSGLSIDRQAAENTLDGLVREMLRPMLKGWLDANLPEMVERVVTREVARITGR